MPSLSSAENKTTPPQAGLLPSLGDFTTDRRVLFVMALALLVGTFSVGAAWFLLRLITLCTNLAFYGEFSLTHRSIAGNDLGAWIIVIPVIGCLVIGFMARYGSEKIRGHGIPEAMEAILIGKSRISPKVAILKPLSSAISIGSGGPFGAEGPIIMTGGAIGSLLAQMVRMTSAERKTLLVAGAAAGMTAIFGTPIAAVLLAVELLLFELKPRSFLPVAAAVIVAAAERGLLLHPAPIFPFAADIVTSPLHVLCWALVGMGAGLGSGLLTAFVYAAEDGFERLPIHWMWWPAIGGLVIGIGGYIEPAALGAGYDSIRDLLAGSLGLKALLLLLVVKTVIWSVSLGSGTSGGILAPLLIIGGTMGALVTPWLPAASPGFWAMMAMAAMMGGTMRAPLTAALFTVEVTGNFPALLPVFTACTVSYAVTVLLLKRSVLTEKLARRGHHMTREYQADPFIFIRVRDVMVSAVESLPCSMTIEDTLRFFASTEKRHKSYPVVDEAGKVTGMVSRSDILAWTMAGHPEQGTLGAFTATQDPFSGYEDELAAHLADRMATAGIGRVPVLDRADGRLLGIVTRKDLLRIRAQRLSEEQDRAVYFPLLPKGGGFHRKK